MIHWFTECQGSEPTQCKEAEVPKNGGLACATVDNKRYCKPMCNYVSGTCMYQHLSYIFLFFMIHIVESGISNTSLFSQGYDFGFLRKRRVFDECSGQTGYQWQSQYVGGNKLAECIGKAAVYSSLITMNLQLRSKQGVVPKDSVISKCACNFLCKVLFHCILISIILVALNREFKYQKMYVNFKMWGWTYVLLLLSRSIYSSLRSNNCIFSKRSGLHNNQEQQSNAESHPWRFYCWAEG